MTLTFQGRRIRVIDVNPELATMWLEQTTLPNRRISHSVVAMYARLMASGQWRPTADPIRLDDKGNVLDGQHRLLALIEAGITLSLVVLDGAELADQDVMDTGRGRKAHQQLSMRHGWKNATAVSSIVRFVMQWHTGTLISNSFRPSIIEITEFSERHRPRLEEATERALSVCRSTSLSRPVVGGFAFTAYDQAQEHPEKFTTDKVNKFLDLLATGAELDAKNPVLVLRDQAFRQKQAKIAEGEPTELYRLIHTWNAWRKGRRYSKLQIKPPITADKLTL